jgi:hypothetical protein
MRCRSHTEKEIRDAIAKGAEVWVLHTGPDREDDVLIGSREDVFHDMCYVHDTSEFPAHWHLEPFDEYNGQ